MTSKWAERARSSPYYPALSHPVFRKVLPGTAASALGDGMSAVAIAWLAIELTPPGHRRRRGFGRLGQGGDASVADGQDKPGTAGSAWALIGCCTKWRTTWSLSCGSTGL